jgi:UDP-3-O-[3-hydroxymyristoyl] glucosamine N-acyltransferase
MQNITHINPDGSTVEIAIGSEVTIGEGVRIGKNVAVRRESSISSYIIAPMRATQHPLWLRGRQP